MSLPPFSGNPLLDLQILGSLSDPDLFSICQSNEYVADLCRDDLFWKQRFISRYGIDISQDLGPYDTYRDAYIKMAQPLIVPPYYHWIEQPGPEYRPPVNAANNGYLSLLNQYLDEFNPDTGLRKISIHILIALISLTAPYRTFHWISRLSPRVDPVELIARLLDADRIDAVDVLLEADEITDIAYEYVSTAKRVKADYIDWLVDHGLEFDELDDPTSDITVGDQLMNRAVSRVDLPLVIYFVKKGADPGRLSDGLYDLLSTPSENAMEVARYLLDKGADPSAAFIQYPTYEEGNPELTRYLIRRGGRVPEDTLNWTVEYGTIEMLRAYLTDPTISYDTIHDATAMTDDPERLRLLHERLLS